MDFDAVKRDYYGRAPATHGVPRGPLEYSDIVLHLPVLEYFASLCGHVTEFGVREGHSTVAMCAGCRGDVVSYDVEESPFVRAFRQLNAHADGPHRLPCRSWRFVRADTGDPTLDIAETDLLFIDTLHTAAHVRKELRQARRVRRFLAFHDTQTCGERDLSGPDPSAEGILSAIRELLVSFLGEWRTAYKTTANNGLWVLERIPIE